MLVEVFHMGWGEAMGISSQYREWLLEEKRVLEKEREQIMKSSGKKRVM